MAVGNREDYYSACPRPKCPCAVQERTVYQCSETSRCYFCLEAIAHKCVICLGFESVSVPQAPGISSVTAKVLDVLKQVCDGRPEVE